MDCNVNWQMVTNIGFLLFMFANITANYFVQKQIKAQDKAIFDLYRIVGDYLRKNIDE